MYDLWLYLVLIATALWGVTNIADKIFVSSYKLDRRLIVFFFGLVEFCFAMLLLLSGVQFSFTLYGLGAFLAGILFPIASLAYYEAVSVEEASRVVPLIFLKPLFVLVMATIFFDEIFTPIKYIGIFSIVIGATLISLRRKKGISANSKAIKFIMVAVLIWALLDIVAKWGVTGVGSWSYLLGSALGFFVCSTFFLLLPGVKSSVASVLKRPRIVAALLSNSVIVTIAIVLYIVAVAFGPIALISAVNSAQAMFVLVFAVIASHFIPKLFKEELRAWVIMVKTISILLIIIGVYLVS